MHIAKSARTSTDAQHPPPTWLDNELRRLTLGKTRLVLGGSAPPAFP